MARDNEDTDEISEIQAPPKPLSALFSNVINVSPHSDFLMLDFGMLAPSFQKPHDLENLQIARFCVDWDAAEMLLDFLKEAVEEHRQEQRPKRAGRKRGATSKD